MKAKDIMTSDVISIRPEASVRDAAALMTEKRISGIPVIAADGSLVGVLSQSDLLHRRELGTETRRKWWLQVFSDPDRLAGEYTKSHGLHASDVMTRHVVSIAPETELADVAAILDSNRIKRLPVLENGRLVGIITRSDLVKALYSKTEKPTRLAISDAELQKTLADRMRAEAWLNTTYVNTVVTDGTVGLWGQVDTEAQYRALRVLVEETPGVNAIDDHIKIGRLPMGVT
jgi:CBS-domain-containing membrane protein